MTQSSSVLSLCLSALLATLATALCQQPGGTFTPQTPRTAEWPPLFNSAPALTLARAEPLPDPSAGTNAPPRRTLAEAKISRNPLADTFLAICQLNFNFGAGPNHDQDGELFNLQPLLPFTLTEDWNLVTRPIFQFFVDRGAGPAGIGDSQISLWPSPARKSPLHWGFGPTIVFPTATEHILGAGKFSAGPSGSVVWVQDPWLVGDIIQDVWSFAGAGSRPAVHQLITQPIVNFALGHRWYLTSAPIFTADWQASSRNRWLVPVGGGLGKIILFGKHKQPVDFTLQAFYHAVRPETGSNWQLRLTITPIFLKHPRQAEAEPETREAMLWGGWH